MKGTRCSCEQKYYVTVKHHYHFNTFNVVIDFQLTQISSRFPEQTMGTLEVIRKMTNDGLNKLYI